MCLLTLVKFTITCIKQSCLVIFQAAPYICASEEHYLMPLLPGFYYSFHFRRILHSVTCMATNKNTLVQKICPFLHGNASCKAL